METDAARAAAPHRVEHNFVLVTDGPAALRMVLHPEASSKSISLPSFWFRYFDIRKEFRRCFKVSGDNSLNVSRMLDSKSSCSCVNESQTRSNSS